MIKAVVFDMDGVIVDSEYTYLESKTEILREAGFPKPITYQYQFMGTTYEFMWTKMKNELGLPESINLYIELMNKKRHEMIIRDGVRGIRGVKELIKSLPKTEYKLAVASSSPEKDIISTLTSLKLIDFFDELVSGEEVTHSKPFPDVYLEAAKRLQVKPEECVAIEDTPNGVTSAKAAGMYVIGFSNPEYPEQDLSLADRIIKTYDEIQKDKFSNLVECRY